MILSRLPSLLQCFFRPFRTALSDDQFRHLWCLVLGLAVNLRTAKLLHLANLAPAAGHRTRHGAFLAHGDWDAPAFEQGMARMRGRTAVVQRLAAVGSAYPWPPPL